MLDEKFLSSNALNSSSIPDLRNLNRRETIQILRKFLFSTFREENSLKEIVRRIENTTKGMSGKESKEVILYAINTFNLAAYFGFPSLYYIAAIYPTLSYNDLQALSYYMAQSIEQKDTLIKKILRINAEIDRTISSSFQEKYFVLRNKGHYKRFVKLFLWRFGILVPDEDLDEYLHEASVKSRELKGKLFLQHIIRKVILKLIGINELISEEELEVFLKESFVNTNRGKMEISYNFHKVRSTQVKLNSDFYNEVNKKRKKISKGRIFSFDAWMQIINS